VRSVTLGLEPPSFAACFGGMMVVVVVVFVVMFVVVVEVEALRNKKQEAK
jgi:hypothetical protein